MTHRDAARPETARPRPHTRPPAQAGRRAYRPARSAPFYHRIRIDECDRATLSPTRDHPGLTPGAALLLAQCLSENKLNALSDLCFSARPEIGTADVDQREPR